MSKLHPSSECLRASSELGIHSLQTRSRPWRSVFMKVCSIFMDQGAHATCPLNELQLTPPPPVYDTRQDGFKMYRKAMILLSRTKRDFGLLCQAPKHPPKAAATQTACCWLRAMQSESRASNGSRNEAGCILPFGLC